MHFLPLQVVLLLLVCHCSIVFAAEGEIARLDLSQFGYRFSDSASALADYSDVSFLSDDLLVISINQRSFGQVEPLFADSPESSIVVFDINRSAVTVSGKMPVEKAAGSVQAISGERFAVLNQKGLAFCDRALHCTSVTPTTGPMFVSAEGKRVAVGGNRLTAQTVIDSASLKQVATYERDPNYFQMVRAIPGDRATLVDRKEGMAIERTGLSEAPIHIDSKGTFSEYRFVSPELLACLSHDASEVVLRDLNGKQVRHYGVARAWRTGILPSASGKRFGIYEHGYTTLNSIINFLDIDDGRPQNFQRVRVVDLVSGDEVFSLEWDPRPGLIKPALSASGHRLARVKAGILEVFQVN